MTTRVLTPRVDSTTVDLSTHLRRKQILRNGTITYDGKPYVFDRPMMVELAKSWQAKALDMVPFMLADADNRHTSDPTRIRGQVVDLEVTDDGLDAVMRLSDDAASLTDEYPEFGVSARLTPNLTRADGKSFPWVLEHVLGTPNPRLTGMTPWAAVNLSDDDMADVIDLSAATYDTPEAPIVATIDLSTLPVDQAQQMAAALTAVAEASGTPVPEFNLPVDLAVDDSDVDDEGDVLSGDVLVPVADEADVESDEEADDDEQDENDLGEQLTDEDLANIMAAIESDSLAGADLSQVDQASIDLANARTEQANAATLDLAVRLAKSEWAGERAVLAGKGVPPYMLDLAAPFLSAPSDTVLDLSVSGGEKAASVGETLRKLLHAAEDTIDLAREHLTPLDGDSDEDLERKARHEKAAKLAV